MTPCSNFKLVTKADAAAIFGVCVKTIDNFVKEGRLPPPVQFSCKEYWHPEDFQAFLDLTFKRQSLAQSVAESEGRAAAACEQSSDKPATRARASDKEAKDSSPVVRQQARQQEVLKRLNG